MAYHSNDYTKKIILLVLFIIILLGSSILIIDFVATFFGFYFPIPGLKQLKEITLNKKMKTIENPYLLEKEELYKDNERLSILDEQLKVKEKELEQKDIELNKKLNILKEKENELANTSKYLDDRENIYKDKQKNIREQAIKIYNMPPKDSVKILEKQSEEDIVDILRAIDSYSAELDRNSTSPYLIKLMSDINNEKAANVLRILKYPVGDKLSSIEAIEDLTTDIIP
jgi:hypothetical protein